MAVTSLRRAMPARLLLLLLILSAETVLSYYDYFYSPFEDRPQPPETYVIASHSADVGLGDLEDMIRKNPGSNITVPRYVYPEYNRYPYFPRRRFLRIASHGEESRSAEGRRKRSVGPTADQQFHGEGTRPSSLGIYQGRPTLRPAPNFNAADDAERLRRSALDDTVLIDILTKRTDDQRQAIVKQFPNLKETLARKLSFSFADLMKNLATPLYDFYAMQVKKAVRFSTRIDEDLLVELLCTLRNKHLKKIQEAYQRLYGKNMDEDIRKFSLNSFAKFLSLYVQGTRDERNYVDHRLAVYDANEIVKAGKLKIDNNSVFGKILITRSFPQLKLTFFEYRNIAGRSIEKTIQKDFSQDIENGLLNIVRTVVNTPAFFADILRTGIKNYSKRDSILIRIILTRAELDMEDIKDAYRTITNTPLASAISKNTMGSFQKALLSLIAD